MDRYLEAFFAHRVLLLTPMLLSVIVGVAFVGSQPRTYRATASMWFQANTFAGDPGRPQDPSPTAAAAGLGVFRELLGTRVFCLAVGGRGPLAAHIQQHGAAG